ncbi:MAG: gluconeogenesis factor YvcK family protein [Minisyncoccia bacterium]
MTLTGGTGGYTLLQGLKGYDVALIAVCTAFDSGGSTGRIRDEFGHVLPPGDIRRCMWALRGSGITPTMELLFNKVIEGGNGGLGDHLIGNILLLAAEQSLQSSIAAIERVGRDLLDMQGTVLPISVDRAHLAAELSCGEIICKEHVIDRRDPRDPRTIRRVWLEPRAFICQQAAEAIAAADLLVLGPGDLYTSLMQILCVEGVRDALRASRAPLVYNLSLMTKAAETRNFCAADFAERILSCNMGRDTFDAVIVNAKPVPQTLLARYQKKDQSEQVRVNVGELAQFTHHIIQADLLSEPGLAHELVRHDSKKLARKIMELITDDAFCPRP